MTTLLISLRTLEYQAWMNLCNKSRENTVIAVDISARATVTRQTMSVAFDFHGVYLSMAFYSFTRYYHGSGSMLHMHNAAVKPHAWRG